MDITQWRRRQRACWLGLLQMLACLYRQMSAALAGVGRHSDQQARCPHRHPAVSVNGPDPYGPMWLPQENPESTEIPLMFCYLYFYKYYLIFEGRC